MPISNCTSMHRDLYRVRHKSGNTPVRHMSVNTPSSHERHVLRTWLAVQLYPQPLYTASQVRTTCRSWDEGVLTDVCLTGVLTDLCLTLYYRFQ